MTASAYGNNTYGKIDVRYEEDGARLLVGKYCSLGADIVAMLGGNHRVDWISTYPFGHMGLGPFNKMTRRTRGNIIVENDVWIGNNAVLMSGITIGNGAIIGAYSVVRDSMPPYSVCYGNPCRVQKYRFDKREREALLKMKWWDWPEDVVKEASAILQSGWFSKLEDFYTKAKIEGRV